MRPIIFCLLAFSFLYCTRRGMADEVMADMMNGNIKYMETGSGPVFHDRKFRTTDRLLQSVKADMGEAWDVEKKFDIQPHFFQVPRGMLSYSFVNSTRGDVELSRIDSTGVLLRDTYPEHRFYYRVVKSVGTSLVQVVLIKEFSDWEVCAILEEGI